MAKLDSNTLNEKWNKCLEIFRDNLSNDEFNIWFAPIKPYEYDDETKDFILEIPTDTFAQRIRDAYRSIVLITIAKTFGGLNNLKFKYPVVLNSPTGSASVTVPSQMSSAEPSYNPMARSRFRIDPNLNSNYTFDSYIVGSCNKGPCAIGSKIAERPGVNWNPMFIFGPSGLGKTHLAQAIGWKVKQLYPEKNVLYVSASQFQLQLQQAAREQKIPAFLNFYASLDFLIVDDIQELDGDTKVGTQNAFFNIFNHLQSSGKHVILTSDTLPRDLKTLDNRIITRFVSGYTGVLEAPDFETKVSILKTAAQKQGVDIPLEIIEYIATNVVENIRVVIGVISSIIANSISTGEPITLSSAREVVDAIVGTNTRKLTIDDIAESVCKHYNLSVNDISTKCRKREVVQARQIAMFLARKYTNRSLHEIGNVIGKRDHSTVIHAIHTVEDLLETDKEISRSIAVIEQELK